MTISYPNNLLNYRRDNLTKTDKPFFGLNKELGLAVLAIVSLYFIVSGVQTSKFDSTVQEREEIKTELHQKQNDFDMLNEQLNSKDKQIEQLKSELQAKKEAESRIASASTSKPSQQANLTASSSSGVEQWRAEVSKYSWPVEQALAVMKCESGGSQTSVGPTNDHGLFQIHRGLEWYGQQIYDGNFNIAIAYKYYYAQRGWQPWTCARKLGLL